MQSHSICGTAHEATSHQCRRKQHLQALHQVGCPSSLACTHVTQQCPLQTKALRPSSMQHSPCRAPDFYLCRERACAGDSRASIAGVRCPDSARHCACAARLYGASPASKSKRRTPAAYRSAWPRGAGLSVRAAPPATFYEAAKDLTKAQL